MKQRKPIFARAGGLVATTIAMTVSGCIPHVNEEQVHVAEPAGPGTTKSAHRATDTLNASADGDSVHVHAEERSECGTFSSTPMEEVDGTRRSLQSGTLAQGLNLALAGGFIALGVGAYAAAGSSCTTTPATTPSDPNPSAVPCTPDQQQQQTQKNQGVAVFLGSLAVLPVGAFVWNLFRAKDDLETVPAPKKDSEIAWHGCGNAPVQGKVITLTAGGTTITGQTDQRGETVLDLRPIASAAADPRVAQVVLINGDKSTSAQVSLVASPAYAQWQKVEQARRAQRAAEAQAKKDADQVARLEQAEHNLAELGPPWSKERMQQFHQLASFEVPNIASASEHFNSAEKARLRAVAAHIDSLTPSFNAAVRAEQAAEVQAARDAIAAIVPHARQLIQQKYDVEQFTDDSIVELCSNGMWMTLHDVITRRGFSVSLCVVHAQENAEMVVSRRDCAQYGAIDQMFRSDTKGAACQSRPHN